ncbi:MAG TPA: exo-beta-N-acetylmuramidase NamZ domain-containing protein [Verrucomicrobiae bacterium]
MSLANRSSRHLRVHSLAVVLLLFSSALAVPAQAVLIFHLNFGKFVEMDAAITNAIADKKLPGGVLWIERHGQSYHKAYGHRALVPKEEPMTEDTIFDAASLTKVIATAPAAMLMIERGKLNLEDKVRDHLPEFRSDGKDEITIRHLMTHTSGLRSGLGGSPPWSGYHSAIQLASAERTNGAPGTVFRYSDINYIVLCEVVQRVSGEKFEELVQREFYQPLKMRDTGYFPSTNDLARIAPTEQTGEGMLRGKVHDPTARRMGGMAGHAGLFTTAADLARFARMMLNLGELDGVRVLKPETVRLMTSVQSPEIVEARRGLGWDIDSGYSRPRGKVFPLGSYGHTGFTGTSIWIDPFSKTFWIFLSNRVHPDGKGNILPLQAALATLAGEAVMGFDFANVPGALAPRTNAAAATPDGIVPVPVLNGIDVLVKQNFAPLKKLRVGLITNHTGVDRRRKATIDLLKNAPDVMLKALFSPEHGIRGALDETVGDSVDEKTGLPVYSLYGERRAPTPEQLHNLDALVFDIQDIGCRFYTYPSTMGLCLEAAAKAKIKFFVLDRVNPINGVAVEGPVHKGESTFVGFHAVPLRHGMTMGELARLFNAERGWNADLTVVPLEGWKREMWFDQTGLPWINPSPNMRSVTEATLYPGLGLHETALSVGRGTGTPFEVIGAPYIDDVQLAAELNGAGLPGLRFVPVRYTPTASTFKEKPCGGVAMVVVDRERLQSVDVGLVIALTLQRLYPKDYALDKISHLLLHRETLEAIRACKSLSDIKQTWAADLAEFNQRREKYLLYK